VLEGSRELDALAGALATHHKEEDWRAWLDAAAVVIERLKDDEDDVKQDLDEVVSIKEEKGDADLLAAGWKQVEGGKWEQPRTGFHRDRDTALKILNDDPTVVEYFD